MYYGQLIPVFGNSFSIERISTILNKEYPNLIDSKIHEALDKLSGGNTESIKEIRKILQSLEMHLHNIDWYNSEIMTNIKLMNNLLLPFGDDYNIWQNALFDRTQMKRIENNLPKMKKEMNTLIDEYSKQMNAIITKREKYDKNGISILTQASHVPREGTENLLKNNQDFASLQQNLAEIVSLLQSVNKILPKMLKKRAAFASFLIGTRADLSDVWDKKLKKGKLSRFLRLFGLGI